MLSKSNHVLARGRDLTFHPLAHSLMPELPGIPTLGGRNSVSVSHVGCRYPDNLAITFSSRAHTSRTLVNANQKPSYILLKNKNKDAKVHLETQETPQIVRVILNHKDPAEGISTSNILQGSGHQTVWFWFWFWYRNREEVQWN